VIERPSALRPALITNQAPKRVPVTRLSKCYRCGDDLVAGTQCIEIPKLGTAYSTSRRCCDACFALILAKTESDLAELKVL